MENQISIRRKNSRTSSLESLKSLASGLNHGSAAIIVASLAALASFTATLLQSDFSQYLCATIALAAVYAVERNNTNDPEGGEI